MECTTCKHTNKKIQTVHKAGQCERCNCGSSEVPHYYGFREPENFAYDYSNNVYVWAERFSGSVRPQTRFRSGGGY